MSQLMKPQPSEVEFGEIMASLDEVLEADDDMPAFLDLTFGTGSWVYDGDDGVWIVRDPRYHGPGVHWLIIEPCGCWFVSGFQPHEIN